MKTSGKVNIEFKYNISKDYSSPYKSDRSHGGRNSDTDKLDIEIPITLIIDKATPDKGFIST